MFYWFLFCFVFLLCVNLCMGGRVDSTLMMMNVGSADGFFLGGVVFSHVYLCQKWAESNNRTRSPPSFMSHTVLFSCGQKTVVESLA